MIKTTGLCVNAGAGSGKTRMLVEKYIEILDHAQGDPARIVAITFTDKAAAEMKTRIRASLEEKGRDTTALADARISTIHGFCTRLLRQHPVEASVDPSFKVLDQVQAGLLLQKTIRASWTDWMENKNATVVTCLEDFSADALMDILEDLVLSRAEIQHLRARLCGAKKESILKALELARASHPTEKKLAKAEWKEMDDRALRLTPMLLDLADQCCAAFAQAKARMQHLDFEDLQLLALQLLNIPRVREKICQDMDYLLVDEFQDTNELQRQIVYHLVPLHALFVVGDPKQSIYRFRGADVSVFRRVQQDMQEHGELLTLDKNYRSVPGVLSLCNDLFSRVMLPSELPYEIPYQPLNAQRQPTSATLCVDAWKHRVGEKEKISVGALRRREAAKIATTLRGWIDGKLCHPEKRSDEGSSQIQSRSFASLRMTVPAQDDIAPLHHWPINPLESFRWKDVAILFRSMGSVYLYERELQKNGIPFTTSSTSAFFGQQCITDMLNALSVAWNFTDDLAMAGFLRSPMVGISDEDLWSLRGDNSLWDSLQKSALLPLIQARTWLQSWHDMAALAAPSELIQKILEDTDFEALVLTQYLGRRKCGLLRKLVELADRFKPEDGFTLQDFIAYLKELVLKDRGESEGQPLEDADAVSLMTVHKAKGLEFPVVIVADLGHHKRKNYPKVLIHEKFGLGMKLQDQNNEAAPTIARLLSELEENQKEEAEAKRILYVACTRAREMLILSGLNPNRSATNPWNHWVQDFVKVDTFIEPQPTDTRRSIPLNPLPAGEGRVRGDLTDAQWKFVMADLSQIKAKPTRLTVSEVSLSLRGASEARQKLTTKQSSRPSQQSPSTQPSPALLGSLTHQILARWDLKNPKELQKILEATLKESYLATVITPESQENIRTMLERFASAPIGQKLQSAKTTRKEIPFILPLEHTAIEGIVDHLYQEEDGSWAVLDYKTDDVTEDAVPARAKHYETQIKLYGAAALQILNLSSIRLELYFLRPGKLWSETFTAGQAGRFLEEVVEEIP